MALSTAPGLATIRLQYKRPGKDEQFMFRHESTLTSIPFDKVISTYRFSACVAMFGSLLRGSGFTKNLNWNDLANWSAASANPNDFLQQEFVSLVQQARNLYSKTKKKKGNQSSN
jgi:Ca-activated chloride channel family protein